MKTPATLATSFYITGGTIPRDAACYVARQADLDLLAGLRQGQYCYVLTSRQMGKSSLMVRTAVTLRQEGVTCVVLDLAAIGQNLDAERWYGGLLNQLGQQVGLEDELDDFWLKPSSLGPMQRWMQALQQVVLKRCSNNLVVFIDEIDAVRSLPFSADEFFAGIRECYNRRVEDADFHRLSFCLLGVATPADLIRDARTTPFNIGKRIELTDFTGDEAAPLATGLTYLLDGDPVFLQNSESEALLKRVLYWTGGHPYLTQRLCSALAEQGVTTRPTSALVDQLCEALFLSNTARERDDNLLFVRERLLRSEVDIAGLLLLYREVWNGKRVKVDEANPLISLLRLSGITRVTEGFLKPRNRIYAHVFDRRWVAANMPDAEVQRQKAAYRRGVRRTLALAGIIFVVMAGLSVFAIQQRNKAQHNASERGLALKEATKQRNAAIAAGKFADVKANEAVKALAQAKKQKTIAERRKQLADAKTREAAGNLALANRRLRDVVAARSAEAKATTDALKKAELARKNAERADSAAYFANMNLLQREWENGNVAHVLELLEETRPYKGRGFEWSYWNRLCHLDLITLRGSTSGTFQGSLSADGRRIVAGISDKTVRVWDVETRKEILTLKVVPKGQEGQPYDYIAYVGFSPDSKHIVTGISDGTVKVWEIETGKEILSLNGHLKTNESYPQNGGLFSRDGKRFVTGSGHKAATIWDVETGKEILTLKMHTGGITSVAFSADGRRIVTGSDDYTARVWDAATGMEILALEGHMPSANSVAFSPDSKYIVIGSVDNTARVWDAATGKEVFTLKGHTGGITSVAFSADGKRIITGSADGTAKVWDAATGKETLTLKLDGGAVVSVAFSADGQRIVAGSSDNSAKVWFCNSGDGR